MKTYVRFLALLSISIVFSVFEVFAQCIPDTANCKDTGDPGQICPRFLPEASVDVPYDEVITVIAPDTATAGEIQIGLAYIVVDSVINLPPGIEYFTTEEKFYPDSTYCIQVTGTPTEAGEFGLEIYVTAFVYVELLKDTVAVAQFLDDTSVVITVNEASGFNPYQVNEFKVLPSAPNPFSEVTRLGFFTPFDDLIELRVYNILGELMHEETKGASPGEHFFGFDGSELLAGTYFYKVTNSANFFTGKIIKSR